MTVVDDLFNRAPAPSTGKPVHVWTGVRKHTEPLSKDQKANPWLCRCPAPMCFYNLSARSEKDATRLLETHPCPWFGGGSTQLDWSIMSASFVEPIWRLLDESMETICGKPEGTTWDEAARDRAKAQARAYANVLALQMAPFFSHPDEIAKEAMRRHKIRQTEAFDPERSEACYATPGIGHLRLKAAEAPLVPRISKAPVLEETTIKAIKGALASTMFTPEQIAPMYNLTVAQVKALI